MDLRALTTALALASLAALAGCDSGRRIGGPGSPDRVRDASASSSENDAEPDAGLIEEDAGLESDAFVADAAEPPDAGSLDAAAPDAVAPDAFAPDAEPEDAAAPDAAAPDAGFADATEPDLGFADAAAPDAGFADAAAGFPDATTHVITDAGTPACTSDVQCASGRCHPLYRQCVPQGQKGSCETCVLDSECGLAADQCLDISVSNSHLETICAQACRSGNDCPRGYECSLNGFCYPIPGSIRIHTCAAVRDMLAAESCNPIGSDTCGLATYDDGTCVPGLGCTIGCSTTLGCPGNSTCTPYFVGDFCVAN